MDRTLVLQVAGLGWNLIEKGGLQVKGLTFHPELTADRRIHQAFLQLVAAHR